MTVHPPIVSKRLPWGARVAMRTRHGRRILADVSEHAAAEGAWWLLPFVVVLALFALAMVTAQAAVPVAVYTLF